jgi:hypothetical protein
LRDFSVPQQVFVPVLLWSYQIKDLSFSSFLFCFHGDFFVRPARGSMKCVKHGELLYLSDFGCRRLTQGFARFD